MCRPVYPVAPVTVKCITAPTLLPRSLTPEALTVGIEAPTWRSDPSAARP